MDLNLNITLDASSRMLHVCADLKEAAALAATLSRGVPVQTEVPAVAEPQPEAEAKQAPTTEPTKKPKAAAKPKAPVKAAAPEPQPEAAQESEEEEASAPLVTYPDPFTDTFYRAAMTSQIDRICEAAGSALERGKVVAELKRIASDVFKKERPMDITGTDERGRFINYLKSLTYNAAEGRFITETPF